MGIYGTDKLDKWGKAYEQMFSWSVNKDVCKLISHSGCFQMVTKPPNNNSEIYKQNVCNSYLLNIIENPLLMFHVPVSVGKIGHVTLVAVAGATVLVPYLVVKSLQLI